MELSELGEACNKVADITKSDVLLIESGAAIHEFIIKLNEGETPKMAALLVEKLINGDDLTPVNNL